MRDDLQELVDEVSRLLGRPGHAGGRRVHPARLLRPRRQPHAGRRWTPSAPARSWPAAPPADPRLVRGVRHRRAPTAPLRTPADEAAGILTRLVHPGAARRAHPRLPVAARRGPHRPRRRRRPRARRRRRPRRRGRPAARRAGRRPTRTSAARCADRAHRRARPRARAVRALGRGPRRAGRQVLVALLPGRGRAARRLAAPGRRRGRHAAGRRTARRSPSCVPLPGRGDLRPAGALAAAVPRAACRRGSAAGVSAVRPGVGDLPAQWRRRAPRPGWPRPSRASPRSAHWAGARRLAAGQRAARARPVVAPLLADPVLTETAEVFLDCAGSASRAAAALQHPPADAVLPARPDRASSPAWTWPTARPGCCCTRVRCKAGPANSA